MSEIEDWSQVAATNSDASPDGWPEGMDRSGVNDSAREGMSVLRRFYEAPEWLDLLTESGDSYTVTKDTNTIVKAVSDGTSTAVAKYPDGSRIRVRESSGGTYLYGYINGTPGFSVETTTFTVDIDNGTDIDVNTDQIQIAIVKNTLGRAAYSPTGTTLAQVPPEIPTIDDLGQVLKDIADGGLIDADLLEGQTLAQVISAEKGGNRNLLMNSQFSIWQRGISITSTSTFPNDDNAYAVDRWRLLSGVAGVPKDDAVVVARDITDRPDGFWSCARLTGSDLTAGPSAERSGLLQILEASDSRILINSNVSLSFYAKVTGTVVNVRGMVLKWTGAENDTETSPIMNWGDAGDAGGPVLNGSWSKVMDTEQLTATSSWTRFTANVQGIDLSGETDAKNFAVLLYVDADDMENGDTVRFTGAQLELSTTSTEYQGVTHAEELNRCQRYFAKTFDEDQAPMENSGTFDGAILHNIITSLNVSFWDLPTGMRATPTVTRYTPKGPGPDLTRLNNDSTVTWTPTTFAGSSRIGWFSEGGVGGQAYSFHATAEAEL